MNEKQTVDEILQEERIRALIATNTYVHNKRQRVNKWTKCSLALWQEDPKQMVIIRDKTLEKCLKLARQFNAKHWMITGTVEPKRVYNPDWNYVPWDKVQDPRPPLHLIFDERKEIVIACQ